MAKIDQVTDSAAPTIGRPDESGGYMPARLKDEIEVTEDGVSDVNTPALIDLVTADMLRGTEIWEKLRDPGSSPAAAYFDHWASSSESFRLAMSIGSMARSRESMAQAGVKTAAAYIKIDELVRMSPEHAERIEQIAGMLLSGCYEVAKSLALAEHARQNSTMRPLVKANQAKASAVNRAQIIATELWQADTGQEYRLGEMAKEVRDILEREGFDDLPGVDRIKEWIKPAAPDYARKGGRRRKTP